MSAHARSAAFRSTPAWARAGGEHVGEEHSARVEAGSEEELEELQQQHAHHEREIDEATQRMIRVAVATRNTGAATLEQLAEQTEQLERVDSEHGRIQSNLTVSARILRNMTSLCGWKSLCTRQKKRRKGRRADGDEDSDYDSNYDYDDYGGDAAAEGEESGEGGGASSADDRAAAAAPRPPAAAPDEEVCGLGTVSNLVSELHEQAQAMNAELKLQSPRIDHLVEVSEGHIAQIQRSTGRTASAGGGGARRAMREGSGTLLSAQEARDQAVAARLRESKKDDARRWVGY